MSAIFPDLLFLGPFFAPLLLRIVIALYFLMRTHKLWQARHKAPALAELVLALIFIAGIATQLFALVGILYVLFRGTLTGKDVPQQSLQEKILTIGILLALTITGAGAFAFDLPY